MQFEEMICLLESLKGKELKSLNPKTGSIVITNIDKDSRRYWIAAEANNKGAPRPFKELEDILFELQRYGFANVDRALYGGNSKRHIPETIFAHLPYIQHFRYKNKKHLLLRKHEIHSLGELNELTGVQLKALKRQIENYRSLDYSGVAATQSAINSSLQQALDSIFKKFPGDADVIVAENALNKLKDLEHEISATIVTLDPLLVQIEDSFPKENISNILSFPLEELIDDESITGIENQPEESVKGVNSKPRIRQLTPTLSLIFDRLTYDEIELQPDFQRKDRIWPADKKSKLIESILMGLPLPVFYFGEKENGNWVIVDGLQRITSVFDFMSGDFELSNLKSLGKYNGKSFRTLDRNSQRRIREYPIISHLIDIKSDSENIIVELFHRINTYGVKLSPQEIRSALNQGSSVTFLRLIAGSEQFKIATHGKVLAARQRDMELCLGALAFMILGYASFNFDRFDLFLSSSMKKLNKYNLEFSAEGDIDKGTRKIAENSAEVYIRLEKRMKNSLILAHKVFGEFAFRKELTEDRKLPVSKPLFELVISVFSFLDEKQRTTLEEMSSDFIDLLYKAIAEDSREYATWISKKYIDEQRGFQYAISTSTGKKVTILYRFHSFINILKRSTGIDVDFNPLFKETLL